MHPRPDDSFAWAQLVLDGFTRAVVRGPSRAYLATPSKMGYNETPYEAEISA